MNPDFLRFMCAALNRGPLAVFLAVAAFTPLTTWSQGIDRNWTGAVNANWSEPNNWSPAGTPQNDDSLHFGLVSDSNRSMVNDLPNLSVYFVNFNNNDYQIDGNALTIMYAVENNDAPAIPNSNASYTTTINCPLIFPLHFGTAGQHVSTGGYGGLVFESTQDMHLNGPIDIDAGNWVEFFASSDGFAGGGNGHLYLSGVISGGGDVMAVSTKDGGEVSTVEFNGTPGNDFTGTLYVFSTPGSSVILNKASGVVVSNRLAMLAGVIGVTATVQINGSSQIDPGATIAALAGGQLTLTGSSITVQDIVLSNYFGDEYASVIDTGGTTVGVNGSIIGWNDSSFIPAIRGNLNLNGFTPFDIGGSSYAGLDMQATMGSAGGVSKTGTAALLLEANDTYGGVTTVNQGTVDVRNNGALGPSPKNTVLAGGSLTLRNVSISGNTLWAEGQSIAGDMPGSLVTCVGSSSWSGPILLYTNLVVVGDITFSGQVSGAGGIGFFGTGTSVLGGSVGNPYTGTTLVRCPVLEFAKPSGVNAYAGPLVVGGGFGGPYEALWLNPYQNGGATLTLYANGVVNLNNNNEDFGLVTFNGGEVDTGTGQFAFYQSLNVNPASTTAVINGYLGLPAPGPAVFNVGQGTTAAGCDLQVNAVMFGNANYFVKQGPGTMCLSGVNTFAGVTLLEAGILDIYNVFALSSQGCVIFDGATLRLNGSGTMPNNFEMVGAGVGGTHGALELTPGSNYVLPGNILLDAGTTINVAQGATLELLNNSVNNTISGNGPLIKNGTGALYLVGSANSTYAGDTIVSAGTLYLGKNPNVLAVPGNLVIGPSTTPVAAVLNQFGNLGGTVVTVNANGLFNLNGNNQVVTQLTLNDGGAVQTGAGTLGLAGGAVVLVGSLSPRGSHVSSSISGNLSLPTGDIATFSVAPYAISPPFATGPELDVPAVITGASSHFVSELIKEGTGHMRLRGNNTFAQSVVVNHGTLIAASSGALPLFAGAVYVNNIGTLALDGGVTFEKSLYLNSSNSPALASWNGTNAWQSAITLQQDTTISVAANGDLQVTGITGNGSLTKIGPGTLQFLAFGGNSYTGLTTVAEGLLESEDVLGTGIPGDAFIGQDSTSGFNAALWLMTGQQMKPTANVTVYSSGFFELHYTSGVSAPTQQLQSVTGKGLLTIDSQAALTLSNNSSFTFAGWLTGAGPLTKAGTGQFLLTDRSGNSTYSGPATVAGGDLRVDALVPGMSVDVKANGRLRGGGQVGGVVVEPAGQLAVDSAVPGLQGGTLTMTSLQLSNSSSLQLNFFGPSPTGGNQEIIATDPVVLSNATFVPSFRYPPREGDVITAIDKTTGGPALGTFAGWVQGQHTLVGTVPVAINYAGGDGNDVTLTVSNLALAFSSYRLAEGNGNQTVEPDECNLLFVSLVNRRTKAVAVTNALLRATTPNALVTMPQAAYPVIAGGATAENSTAFQFRTDPALPCGSGVSFELVLWTATEGQFAVDFSVVGGLDCTHPTGPCLSCAVVSGQFDSNSPVSLSPLYFVGAPSICYPPKACPGADPGTNLAPFPYVVHAFSNPTTNELCLTAQLQFNCPAEPTNDLGVAAYLGGFDPNQPCSGYLGDLGLGGPPYPPFSFRVPAGSNFVLVVMARTTNLVCNAYSLELFGLPCPLPTLAISPEAAPNTVRVHWSTAYPGWTAQQEGSLSGTFSNAAQLPAIIGGRYSLTNITTVTNQFYRLAK